MGKKVGAIGKDMLYRLVVAFRWPDIQWLAIELRIRWTMLWHSFLLVDIFVLGTANISSLDPGFLPNLRVINHVLLLVV